MKFFTSKLLLLSTLIFTLVALLLLADTFIEEKIASSYKELSKKHIQESHEKIIKNVVYTLHTVASKLLEDTANASLDQSTIPILVKEHLAKTILEVNLKNPDMYIAVNKIVDFKGGDNYATPLIHPYKKTTNGMYLSTNIQDIKGNFVYLDELEGINKKGEVLYDHFFLKKTTKEMVHQLSFAKLFEPLDWLIVAGVSLNTMDKELEKENSAVKAKLAIFQKIFTIVFIVIALLFIFILYKKEQNDLALKEKELKLSYKREELKNYQQVLYSMLDLVEKRDTYTAGHTQRVAKYAVLIAEALELPQDEIDLLYESAIMHDIGKVTTPDTILLKPGQLNENEFKIIKGHLTSGYEILVSMKAFEEHAKVMRDHHERYDGGGYPRGIKGHEISTLSHILILADAFDAMTSTRIYRPKKELEEALVEILECRGTQFAPDIVDAAYPVLKRKGVIPADHKYLNGEMEEARVAFYYKDTLTGLYNYRYLDYLLKSAQHTEGEKYTYCDLITLTNFSEYNEKLGWLKGDKKLCEVSHILIQKYKTALIFRIFGDDFLVLRQEQTKMQKDELLADLSLENSLININVYHFNLSTLQVNNFIELSTHISKSLK